MFKRSHYYLLLIIRNNIKEDIVFESVRDRDNYAKFLEKEKVDVVLPRTLTREQFIELSENNDSFILVRAKRFLNLYELNNHVKKCFGE